MSEPKLISPMLDNFDMGGVISNHDGVRCCPAMRKDSNEKYIVKIISVPASQTKLDALLLTGAYPDKDSALAYFKELAEGIVDEKKILDTLAQLEGFVTFEDCQIVPMDDATGYDVYLLSEYRISLERQNAKTPMTQLAAVNLALDLCAAMSVCRRSGYMCVDLKPSNIYVIGDKEYRIGDLGFVRLNSLKYESLPDKYRSCYTAPELEDAFASLNETMDIYSTGIILYQVFNGGALPLLDPNSKLEAPAYADEEMAQIILKACDPNPDERWQDPVQMGQAIVSYMQKNGVNETPLTAEFFGKTSEEPAEEKLDETPVETIAPIEEVKEVEDVVVGEASEETEHEESLEDSADSVDAESTEVVTEETNEQIDAVAEEVTEAATSDVTETVAEDVVEKVVDETTDKVDKATVVTTEAQPQPIDAAANTAAPSESTEVEDQEEEYDNLSFLDNIDEIVADVDENYEGLTDEVSEILGQIDELTSHQVPDPVVAPDPIEIKIPEPLPVEEATNEGKTEEDCAEESATEAVEQTNPAVEVATEELPPEEMPYIPKKKRTGLIWSIILIIVLALGIGGYFFYTQYYLQPIYSLEVEGIEDSLQVQLTADVDESLLTVVCADSHGDKVSAPVVGGKAVFTGLSPDTAYTVSVAIDGFHELTGVTSKVYSTPVQTKIAQMNVVTGAENGSIVLSFAVEGPDSEQWNVIYNAEGEAERVTSFPAHMVTLAGLTVGKEYTFRLEPTDDIYLAGETEISYVARNLVCAENLHISAFMDGSLTAQWETPDGEAVSEWSVRCYSESGFEESITTAENTATFNNIDENVGYTVEVTAVGMSVNQRVVVGANSVTISDFTVDTSRNDTLSLSWSANRDIPAEGWTIRYSVNDINAVASVMVNENKANLPIVPNGNYEFTILDGHGNVALGGPFTHVQADAAAFEGFSVKQSDITIRLCKTPAASSWSYKDLKDEDYVNSFAAGEKISMVLSLSGTAENSNDPIAITYAIYDEDNNLVSFDYDSQIWKTMWYQNYCELDIPSVPTDVGTYNLIVYFNAMEVGSQKFAIIA